MSEPDPVYAGQRVCEQRLARGDTQSEAARFAGVSDTTWNVVENGRGVVGSRSAALIMRYCGWTADSYRLLLARKRPKPLAQPPTPDRPTPDLAVLYAELDALRERVRSLEEDRSPPQHRQPNRGGR